MLNEYVAQVRKEEKVAHREIVMSRLKMRYLKINSRILRDSTLKIKTVV